MMEILEEATKFFNVGQSNFISIGKTFFHGGQDPWEDCEVEFKAHMDALSELSL